MPVVAMELHEVLEQEYVSMYGELEMTEELRSGAITAGQFHDFEQARDVFCRCTGEWTANAEQLATALEAIRTGTDPGGRTAEIFADVPGLHSGSKHLAANLESYAAGDERARASRRIIDDLLCDSLRSLRDQRLANLYRVLHARARFDEHEYARTALCISGGGIRSATFALGVLQGLASSDLLSRFDYISTVSGGGYIGSWLSSWSRRDTDGIRGVERQLARADIAEEEGKAAIETKIEPEPRPVRHLRDYSNYLTPRLGLLSADTWTMAALYLRNLLLNWLVLLPSIAIALSFPRVYAFGLRHANASNLHAFAIVSFVATLIGFAVIGVARPVTHGRRPARWMRYISPQTGLAGVLVAMFVVGASALSIVWAILRKDPATQSDPFVAYAGFAAFVVTVVVPTGIYFGRYYWSRTASGASRPTRRRAGGGRRC